MAIDHHLAVVQTWTLLARACHDLPGWDLIRVIPEWELRTLPETAAYPLIPDALMELSVSQAQGDALVRMAVEVDLGTEGLSVLRRKVANYSRLLGTEGGLWGWTNFGLAFAVLDWKEERRQKFQDFLEGSWPGWWILWDLETGPAKELADALNPPLTTSPYRKGRSDPVSA